MASKIYFTGLLTTIFFLSACSPSSVENQTIDATKTSLPSDTPFPTQSPIPQPTPTFAPLFEIGTVADLAISDDYLDIKGRFEIISLTEIKVTAFLFTIVEAPGVDIRLGVDRDFSDEVAVSLRDITGKIYNGRDFTITIPPEAFDGRSFNSIGIYCYATGDLFDFIVFENPPSP